MKTPIYRLIVLLLVITCSFSTAFSQENADYKGQIAKINKEMKANMLSGNNDASLKFYTDDAISMPAYEPMHVGIEAIKKANEEMAKSGWKVTAFEPTTFKISSSGKLVTEVGTYKISFKGPGADMAMDDVGKYLTVYQVQADKSLKVKIETWNSDKNPMEQEKKK
ncbi:MAG: DUF4440 domain-containing protein [Bacteroidetes bacterium]|nr:DUF4440 domain-containing protein [Bacteroidota bacterium]